MSPIRYPPGVKLPPFARFYDNVYWKVKRYMKPQFFGVLATVTIIGAAFWMIAIQPMISNEYYAEKQRERWKRMPVSREQLAGGLPVWRDPFDREDRKTPSYAK
ncbi:hypothetical protein niasHS_000654 [Heterodera schachtii]|uniref:Uncharacterized protein n=1 Tax=Heterodera schachtii TaxID=97005 RepID=A0ABD2K4V9_HETSC